ncbi:hypothetical protein PoB_004465700 [Plakobranchus ocellatus]|uniref:Uncharacterized protein n=1 Tax=Plakobranchus ocellatus TaxID=259542 RepID=A0AAV4BGR0_9GAST|nr:hypothetical protein PoB_004465700 [Plakobranchus ocellatus]
MKLQSKDIGVEFKVWAPTFNRVTHRLYLLGSLKELGAWAIEAALEAFPTTGSASGVFRVSHIQSGKKCFIGVPDPGSARGIKWVSHFQGVRAVFYGYSTSRECERYLKVPDIKGVREVFKVCPSRECERYLKVPDINGVREVFKGARHQRSVRGI